jgi:hypothetical protein
MYAFACRLSQKALGPTAVTTCLSAASAERSQVSTRAITHLASRPWMQPISRPRLFSNSSERVVEKAAEKIKPSSTGGFLQWYEGHLSVRPVFTKMVTGCLLWGVGDAVAQTVPHMASSESKPKEFVYDWPRTGRACFFGFALHAPTSHVHFNFLEYLTHRVGVTGLGIPVFKAVMEQVCDRVFLWIGCFQSWSWQFLTRDYFYSKITSSCIGVGFLTPCITARWAPCKVRIWNKFINAFAMYSGKPKRRSGSFGCPFSCSTFNIYLSGIN